MFLFLMSLSNSSNSNTVKALRIAQAADLMHSHENVFQNYNEVFMTCKEVFYKQTENIHPNQLEKLLSLGNFLVCMFQSGERLC